MKSKGMKKKYDCIIVGAGPVGCVLAERMANSLGLRVLIIEKRDHIAGNCYDEFHKSGVLIHKYGPHYFRTNNPDLVTYLSQFTDWIPGNYIVTTLFNKEHFPFPINKITINKFFKKHFKDSSEVEYFLKSKQIPFNNPSNSEEFVLSRVGKELYEAFYLGYTLKQWDIHPKDLAPSVCGRIPVRYNDDSRYVDHEHQLTPKDGFHTLFKNMVSNPLIDVSLNSTFSKIDFTDEILIYTGPVDEYFDFKFGKLPWRSLDFDFVEYDKEFVQDNVQINYPNDFDYTRSVEIKHVTNQKIDKSVISFEYPVSEGDPYYPIPTDSNETLYKKYKELADLESLNNKVYFCGRLAEYKYYNTDEVIERALSVFAKIKSEHFEN